MAKDVWSILRKKYPEKEYALMAEVSDMAGFHRSRSADYIAVNLWPSRGLAINGIELKSFRSDFLNELKNPKKAENIFQFCDYFWLLTTDDTIAKLEEIPDSWGWMCIKGERIFIKKDAPKLAPIECSKHFLVAMLKRAQDKTNFVHRDSIQDEINTVREYEKKQHEHRESYRDKEHSELQKNIREFEEASGIKIDRYSHHWNASTKKIGEAVKFLTNGGAESIKQQLLDLQKTANGISSKISLGLSALTTEEQKKDESTNA